MVSFNGVNMIELFYFLSNIEHHKLYHVTVSFRKKNFTYIVFTAKINTGLKNYAIPLVIRIHSLW